MELYSSQILELVKQLARLKKEYLQLANEITRMINALESLFIIDNEEETRLGFSFDIRTRVKGKPVRFVKKYWSKKVQLFRGRDDRVEAWIFVIDNIDKIIENIEKQYEKHQKEYAEETKDSDSWARTKCRDKLKGEKFVLNRLKQIRKTLNANQTELTKFGNIIVK